MVGATAAEHHRRERAQPIYPTFKGYWRLAIPYKTNSIGYYPLYYSKYNPIERCWGILEVHWNGTKLVDLETMLEWAKRMTWKGMHPLVKLSRTVCQKGIILSQRAMRAVEARLKRHPELPCWDILIRPASLS